MSEKYSLAMNNLQETVIKGKKVLGNSSILTINEISHTSIEVGPP